jgi:membrane carboxypeptidase/penicillin-binding protein PbpC
MKKIYVVLFCAASLFLSITAYSQEIVFTGVPVVKNSSSHEKSTNEKLEGQDQITYKLTIAKEGKEYYWYSRDRKPLKYKQSGRLHYFYDDAGASYIKIMEAEKGKYIYIEHVSLGFSTMTYWGGGSRLEL